MSVGCSSFVFSGFIGRVKTGQKDLKLYEGGFYITSCFLGVIDLQGGC